MTPTLPWNRRRFLGTTLAAGAAWSMGWPLRASWAIRGPASPVRLAYYTDIHARVEWETPRAMALCADRINEQRADLIICGGDLVTDGYESTAEQIAPRWTAYREALHDRLEAPSHAAIGNHDLVGVAPKDGSAPAPDARADFLRFTGLPRAYRSLNAGGCHIVFLDPFEITADALRYRGVVDPAQLSWLHDDLRQIDPETPVILVCHMPLMTGFYQATEGALAAAPPNRVLVNSREVLQAFARNNLVLVLQGHLHVNEMLRWRDTTFITGGSVCGQWWRGPWQGTPEGFGVVTLRKDRIDWEYQSFGWQALRPPGV